MKYGLLITNDELLALLRQPFSIGDELLGLLRKELV